METWNGVLSKLPLRQADGSAILVEMAAIFYLEADGENTLIRTRRKRPYRSVERLAVLEKKLPQPPFVRCHREYVVNLNRVQAFVPRTERDDDLRLDPPVNRRIPVGRERLAKIRSVLGL